MLHRPRNTGPPDVCGARRADFSKERHHHPPDIITSLSCNPGEVRLPEGSTLSLSFVTLVRFAFRRDRHCHVVRFVPYLIRPHTNLTVTVGISAQLRVLCMFWVTFEQENGEGNHLAMAEVVEVRIPATLFAQQNGMTHMQATAIA